MADKIDIKCSYTRLVSVDDLKPHPKNPNRHTPKQIKLLGKLIARLGMRSPIVVSSLSGYIVAGHGRLEACKRLRMREVPVDYQDFTDEAQEMAFLMSDNRVSEFSELDTVMSKSILDEIAADFDLADLGFSKAEFKDLDLQKLLEEEPVPLEKPADGEVSIYKTSIEPVQFPSSNKWDIPDLRADMIPDDFDVSAIWKRRTDEVKPGMMYLWGSNAFPQDTQGGLCAFYVDDERFERVCYEFDASVEAGEKIKACNFAAAVSPNLSLWRNTPLALQLYRTYVVRDVARLWQEMGIKVIPDVNWSDERSYDFCFLGIPKNAPIVSIQCRTSNTGTPEAVRSKQYFLKGLRKALEVIEPKKILIYGGALHRKWIEANIDFGDCVPVWLDAWTVKATNEPKKGGEQDEED